MCGITGYLFLNGNKVKDNTVICKMLTAQKHRGPDDSGIIGFNLKTKVSEEISYHQYGSFNSHFEGVLGFNRLSILDLSEAGHQPMASPDRQVYLMLNGEIYNAFDIKPDLQKWGYKFRSTSDTEVVLALYLRYGFETMLLKLNGMFAIVIVDLNIGKLFIARDRFGIKPMYFNLSDQALAFSSELKSFKYQEGFKFELDSDKVDEYLIYRNNLYGTLFKNVDILEPGWFMEFSHDTGLRKSRYFDINSLSRNGNYEKPLDVYEKSLEEWLTASVQSQLMSDVKLGCQLSGGVDSSLVTFMAARNSAKGLFESVSIVFDNPKFSEEKYIDQVAESLKLNSHKFLLDASYYIDHFEKATFHFESPLNHPNTIGIYLLSQRAKEYVTVLLSGEGADEVFGGYTRFYDVRFPLSSRKMISHIKNNITHLKLFLPYFDPGYRTILATSFMNPLTASLILPGFSLEKAMATRQSLYRTLNGSIFDKQVKYEIQAYMPDLLIRQDKMSMAHSIENRVPYLDNAVVENSFRIPEKYLLTLRSEEGRNTEKYLLKKIISNYLGREFAFRNKMGFGIPVGEYFRSDKFHEYLHDKILLGIKNRGLFNNGLITNWATNIDTIDFSDLESLWIVIAFEVWAQKFIDLN